MRKRLRELLKRLAGPLAACAALSLLLTACPWFNGPVDPDLPTAIEAKDCSKEAAKQSFYELFPTVNRVLAQGGGMSTVVQELATMVGKYGINVISCLVDRIGAESASAAVAVPDQPIHQLKRDRADIAAKLLEQARASSETHAQAADFMRAKADAVPDPG